jgi:hypothetical protein
MPTGGICGRYRIMIRYLPWYPPCAASILLAFCFRRCPRSFECRQHSRVAEHNQHRRIIEHNRVVEFRIGCIVEHQFRVKELGFRCSWRCHKPCDTAVADLGSSQGACPPIAQLGSFRRCRKQEHTPYCFSSAIENKSSYEIACGGWRCSRWARMAATATAGGVSRCS